MYIEYDLEEHPLQIKTDSVVGSNEKVGVRLYTSEEAYISRILLRFDATPKLYINRCTSGSITFPVDLPTGQNKIWTITKTTTALKIECNDVVVLDYLYTEFINSDCVAKFSKDVEKIWFTSSDDASDEYRQEPIGV